QVLHDEPRPPRRLNDRIPRDLETICLKTMTKEPCRRYETGHELALDLRRFMDGKPILARPVGWLERSWRCCRRNPRFALAIGVTSACLVATAVIAVLFAVNRGRMLVESNRHLAL